MQNQHIWNAASSFWHSLGALLRLFLFLTMISLAFMIGSFVQGDLAYKMAVENIRYPLGQPTPIDMWFSESRELLALQCSPSSIVITKWSLSWGRNRSDKKVEETVVTSQEVTGAVGTSFHCETAGGGDQTSVKFAVSIDGNHLAWIHAGYLSISRVASPKATLKRFELRSEQLVQLLSFTDVDLVALVYDDGSVDAFDLKIMQPWPAGGRLSRVRGTDGRWALHSAAGTMDLWSLDTGRLASVRIKRNYEEKFKSYAHPAVMGASAVATFGGDRMAVGRSGEVVLLFEGTAAEPKSGIPLPLYPEGRVGALVYYDESRVLVVGNFEGIYLLTARNTSSMFEKLNEDLSPGSRRIRVSDRHMSAIVNDSLAVGEIRIRPQLTNNGAFWLSVGGVILTLLSTLFALFQEMRNRR